MYEYLYKYLVLYRKLCILQLGSFTIDTEPARFDVQSSLLFAPKPVIHFWETAEAMPDRIFFDFLSKEMGVEEMTAIKEFIDFSYTFRNNLQENGLAVLPGVGRIAKGAKGDIFFTAESGILELLPHIEPGNTIRVPNKKAAKELVKDNAYMMGEWPEEDVETNRKDYWWVYAIVLLVIGSVALLFYYQ